MAYHCPECEQLVGRNEVEKTRTGSALAPGNCPDCEGPVSLAHGRR